MPNVLVNVPVAELLYRVETELGYRVVISEHGVAIDPPSHAPLLKAEKQTEELSDADWRVYKRRWQENTDA